MDTEKQMDNRKTDYPRYAIWALTPKAGIVAAKLIESLGEGKLFAGPSIKNEISGAERFYSLQEAVAAEFTRFSSHIFIMAAGIVVRTIAPLIKSKLTDPAVVVIDDHARFVISLLSGHLGGANDLASRLAIYLDAEPVITTATDIDHVPAIDLLAGRYGFAIENPEAIKNVHMAMLQRQKILLHDPMNFLKKDLHGWYKEDFCHDTKIIPGIYADYKITELPPPVLVLRPKVLSIGIGCNRNTPVEEILNFVKTVFKRFGFSANGISNIGTIAAKTDEEGILGLARVLKVPVRFFGKDELGRVESVPTPSEVVKKHMGVASVCEASAILASEQGRLLVPKQRTPNVTLAVAVRRFMLSE